MESTALGCEASNFSKKVSGTCEPALSQAMFITILATVRAGNLRLKRIRVSSVWRQQLSASRQKAHIEMIPLGKGTNGMWVSLSPPAASDLLAPEDCFVAEIPNSDPGNAR